MTYRPIIGLEIHTQLATKTKMFCGCDNDSWNKEPNVNTCPVCTGMPGQLPVINAEAVRIGAKLGLALGCEIPEVSRFDRKNYFYPDNPSGYQITQLDSPVAINGKVVFYVDGEKKEVRIDRSHLENDAGKLTHVSDGSLLDLNRAGTPLAEIVSMPDMHSGEEAKIYAQTVRSIVLASETGHANLERGEMRFDVNVSLEVTKDDGSTVISPITEVKNVNSFNAITDIVDYESRRIKAQFEQDGLTKDDVSKTTRGWNADKKETFIMREKEDEADYRYFPEPDLPPVYFSREDVAKLEAEMPEMPVVRAERFADSYEMDFDQALSLTYEKKVADYFEEVTKVCGNAKLANNWITGSLFAKLSENEGKAMDISQNPIAAADLGEMIKLIDGGDISGKIAKDVFEVMWTEGGSPAAIVEEKGWKQVSDTSAIEPVCQEVLDNNPDVVADYKGGKEKALAALIGQVMKATQGQANPGMVTEIFKKLIG